MNKRSPIVFQFIGVPGSGKSYFARKLAEQTNTVRINSDAMRLALFGSQKEIGRIYNSSNRQAVNSYVFGAMDYVAGQLLEKGQDVIYDSNQNKRSDRKSLEDIAAKYNARAILIRVKTPKEVALQRGVDRPAQDDQRQLPKEKMVEVIERHARNTQHPADDEIVIEIDGTVSFDEQYKSFKKQLVEVDGE